MWQIATIFSAGCQTASCSGVRQVKCCGQGLNSRVCVWVRVCMFPPGSGAKLTPRSVGLAAGRFHRWGCHMADWPGKTPCLSLFSSPLSLFPSLSLVSLPPSLYFVLLSLLSHFLSLSPSLSPALPLSLPLVSNVCLWPVVCSVRITIKQRRRVAEGRGLAFTCWVRPQHSEQHIAANLVPLLIYPPPTCAQTHTLSLPVLGSHCVFSQNVRQGFFWEWQACC